MINGFARYYTHYVLGRGRPRNAVHRSRSLLQAPHQLPNYLGARKIERRLRLDDDHDGPEREGGR